MDFEISEEAKMIQGLVRDFVVEQLKPLERGLLGRAADLSDAIMYLPPEKEQELIKMVRDMGLWGLMYHRSLAAQDWILWVIASLGKS